jgi:hypothetical protein
MPLPKTKVNPLPGRKGKAGLFGLHASAEDDNASDWKMNESTLAFEPLRVS